MVWQVHSNMMREIAQTLQEARKMARSIENTAGSLLPLTDESEHVALSAVVEHSRHIAGELTDLYNGIARQAFGPEAKP